MPKNFFVSTSIPYVNADPHIGHAQEFVLADIIARYQRQFGDEVSFLSGTDDNALKNVQAAEAAGVPVSEWVSAHALHFKELLQALTISNTDFIQTASDPRHVPGAQKLWEACRKNGDIGEPRIYRGFYCVGCEEFKTEKEMVNGECPEHPGKKLEIVEEKNYFFNLKKYGPWLKEVIDSQELRIIPETRRNEILSFIDQGLEDFSISRSKERAKGWGVPVPGDDRQVMYVWFDALSNYINALGYAEDSKNFKKFWEEGNTLHVIGKGINRFHTIYWPAMLKSASIALPKTIFVHGYVTVGGQKMSKSLGNVVDPLTLFEEYKNYGGADTIRYFLARHIHPFEDSDFTIERFKEAYNANLADGIGNLTARIMKMAQENLDQPVGVDSHGYRFQGGYIDESLSEYRIDKAMEYIWAKVADLDREIDEKKPFILLKEDFKTAKEVIKNLVLDLYRIGCMLKPFMPRTAEKIIVATRENKKPENLFPRKD